MPPTAPQSNSNPREPDDAVAAMIASPPIDTTPPTTMAR